MENRRKVSSLVLFVSCLLLGAAVGCSDGASTSPQTSPATGSVTSSAGATDIGFAGGMEMGGGPTSGTGSVANHKGGEAGSASKTGVGGKSANVAGFSGEAGEDEIAGGGSGAVAGETSVAGYTGEGGSEDAGAGGDAGADSGGSAGSVTDGGSANGGVGNQGTGVGGKTIVGNGGTSTGNGGTSTAVGGSVVVAVGGVPGIGGTSVEVGGSGIGGDSSQGGLGVGGLTGNGGSTVVSVGGAGVGGATGNGGNTGVGGVLVSNGGTSVGNGGSGVGGMIAVGGSGTGGVVTCDPIPLAGPSGAVATSFGCTGSWERDLALDTLNASRGGDLTLTDDIQCFAGGECFLATSSYASGYVAHKQAGVWHLEETPSMAVALSVHGTSASSVWVGGVSVSGSVAIHLESGTWIDRSAGLRNEVVDIHAVSASRAYAATFGMEVEADSEGRVLGTYARSRVYRWNGNSWTDMSAPSSRETRFMRFWVGSDESVIVVGMFTDTTTGLLFRWDGCEWTDFSNRLPGDVDSVNGVDVNSDGEIYAVGSLASGGGGVVLKSTNLVDWTRHNEPELASNSVVLSPRVGTAIVGGALPIDGNPDWKGVVSVESEGAWTGAEPVAQEVEFVTGISVLGSTVHVSTMRGTAQAGVYTQTCQ